MNSKIHEMFPSFYPESPSNIDDLYSFEQYPELFKNLNLLDISIQKEIPKGIPPQNQLTAIPSILHYVWLGKNPIPEESRKNISFFCDQIKQHLHGICVIWTDQTNLSKEVENWLKSHGIFLVQVQAVFGNPSKMETFYHFYAALAKIPANYGEASDLLRYEILDRFGGYYLDHDISKEIDFTNLIKKGGNPPHGFVGARIEGRPRNDIIGGIPRTTFFKKLKEITLDNYTSKSWKKDLKYNTMCGMLRPYLTDSTTFLTGPWLFGIAVAKFFKDLKLPYFEDFAMFTEHSTVDQTFIVYNYRGSAEEWVYRRTDKDFLLRDSKQISLDRMAHDFLLSLDKDEKILDFLKYEQHYTDEQIIPTLENLIKTYPLYFSKVDRIFTKRTKIYEYLRTLLEELSGSEIDWNELAALKVACLTENVDMVEHLISKVNPFISQDTHVGEYDCSDPSPLSIAVERGNIEIIEKIINYDPPAAIKCLQSPRGLLIYAGYYYAKTYSLHVYLMPLEKLNALGKEKRNAPLDATSNSEENDRKIKKYQKVKARLEDLLSSQVK